ncbi:MAG: DEAD/DEAH box helicase [Spirochaetaceae bacterium]
MTENINDFKALGLTKEICKAVNEKGYITPTEIQNRAIPLLLKNKDLIAISQTGTGKTASFTLPILQKITKKLVQRNQGIRSLILVPTRELAVQVGESVNTYSKYLNIKVEIVLGGVNINPQMQKLRGGADILIATPGRLLDLFEKNALNFDCLDTLVLDEADKLLDMGFTEELDKIIKLLPKKRQNLMFSATFPEEIRILSEKILYNPIDIRVEEEITTADTIEEWLYPVDKSNKTHLLLHLFKQNKWDKVLVFAKSQNRVDRLCRFLESKGVIVDSIHGKKTQFSRTNSLDNFKDGETQILVATDLASRGIDIKSLPIVINYDLPQVPENYIHRIGRTGRAGESGISISFASEDEFEYLVKIERQIQTYIKRKVIDGFEPTVDLMPSPRIKALKPKKPKKKK